MVICTIAARNYFDKAANLASSLRQHAPKCTRVLCVPERELGSSSVFPEFDVVILANELGLDRFDHLAFRHTLYELSTAIKATLLQLLMCSDLSGESGIVVFLDPDVDVCGPLDEAISAAETSEIVVTPYMLYGRGARECAPVLSRGAHNLGFLGLRRGEVSLGFLDWWADKLCRLCYSDSSRGLFVDQKWIDVAFSLFPIHILRHPGYNLAYWNCNERPLTRIDSSFFAAGAPLRFVHFSGMDTGKDLAMLSRVDRQTEAIFIELRTAYERRLKEYSPQAEHQEWSYSRFRSGERIALAARRIAAARPELLLKCNDPFAESNEYFLSLAQK